MNNTINENQQIKIICLNNIYKNPYKIREQLLLNNFSPYVDNTSLLERTISASKTQSNNCFSYYLPCNINLNKIIIIFEHVLGKKIKKIISNEFFINIFSPQTENYYRNFDNNHSNLSKNDNNYWIAIIFLTPYADIDKGIKIYNKDDLIEDEIGNLFNRLVIIRSNCNYNIGCFGSDIDCGNLYQKICFSVIE